ncbi:MAG: urease accessory UreF family protein [Chloroflexota bacterium]
MRTADLLATLQLADSAFPTGGFVQSHGLEAVVETGAISGRAAIAEWIGDLLLWQMGPSEGSALAGAWQLWPDLGPVADIDRYLTAARLAREPREQSLRLGRRLAATLAEVAGGSDPDGLALLRHAVQKGTIPGNYAVVLGAGCAALGVPLDHALAVFFHQVVAEVLGAAVRLTVLDPIDAQVVRRAISPRIEEAMTVAMDTPWKEMYACAYHTEIMSMKHETMTSRLFAT